MNAAWIVLVGGIAVAVALVARSWLRRYQDLDLGRLSERWIAEQRFDQGRDLHR